jgi:hypothetical protein
MTKTAILSLALVVFGFLGMGARSASALICCSVCDEKPNSPACAHGCSPSCFVDDEPIAADSVVYDEVAQTCSAAPAVEPALALASN